MRRPGGYAIITCDEGIKECDTFTCHHCNRVVHVPVKCRPEDLGGFCGGCSKLICSACVTAGKCAPIEKWLEAQERRHDTLRSYGLL